MRVLFLCTELAGYFANCIELLYQTSGSEILVINSPNSKKAPFKHDLPGIRMIDRKTVYGKQLEELCINYNPNIVYIAGWVDVTYMRIARKLKNTGAPVVCGLDNVWRGTFRQRVACLMSSMLIKPFYSHIWVAGHRQYQFARRLGYSYDKILTGLYAADIQKFKSISENPLDHRLVFVGRLEKIKGIEILYKIFSDLTEVERKGWTLEIIGNGSLKDNLLPTASISVYNFMQPDALVTFVGRSGGFILPSLHEPWGVVVQEFASAGKPLILSSAVNSGENYLIHGYNGFRFANNDEDDLRQRLIAFFALPDAEREAMGRRSIELAVRDDPKYWVANFLSLLT